MALNKQCFAIVREATTWVLNRLTAMPEYAQQRIQTCTEYPALLIYEVALNEACIAGDLDMTREAARQYCTAWRNAFQRLAEDAPITTAQ